LGFGEGEDEFFLIGGEDERGKGGVVESYVGDFVDEEGEPAFGLEGVAFEEAGGMSELVVCEGDSLGFHFAGGGVVSAGWDVVFIFRVVVVLVVLIIDLVLVFTFAVFGSSVCLGLDLEGLKMRKAVWIEFSICECVDNYAGIDGHFDVLAAHVLADGVGLVGFVVVAVVVFEELATLEELRTNLLLLWVELDGDCVECRNRHCAAK